MEWMPITWLKDDLKAVARRMEAEKVAAAAAAAATHVTGRKRSWAGLGWDGADEGLPRRGRSAGMGERRAAEASAAAPPAADAAQAAVAALPLIEVCPLPAGGAPEGIAVVLAQPAGWLVRGDGRWSRGSRPATRTAGRVSGRVVGCDVIRALRTSVRGVAILVVRSSDPRGVAPLGGVESLNL